MQRSVVSDQRVVDEVERKKWKIILQTVVKDWRLYVLLIPMLAFLICFKYIPVFSILQGFKYDDFGKLQEGDWAGFYWLNQVLVGGRADVFWKAFRNTFVNSMYGLIFGFPLPIILALMFSEVKQRFYLSFLQVASYLPHFISTVVMTTIVRAWAEGPSALNTNGGIMYQMFVGLGWNNFDNGIEWSEAAGGAGSVLNHAKFFRPIYQITGVWEGAGYGSIVYFAAILAISPTSYEAARIDGATKMQQIRYVTFPGMAPTLTIMLITRIGHILNVGYEKILLLTGDMQYSYETSEVISTYVYKMTGQTNMGVTSENPIAMVGIIMDLFNSLIAMVLVLGANAISRRVSSTSLF